MASMPSMAIRTCVGLSNLPITAYSWLWHNFFSFEKMYHHMISHVTISWQQSFGDSCNPFYSCLHTPELVASMGVCLALRCAVERSTVSPRPKVSMARCAAPAIIGRILFFGTAETILIPITDVQTANATCTEPRSYDCSSRPIMKSLAPSSSDVVDLRLAAFPPKLARRCPSPIDVEDCVDIGLLLLEGGLLMSQRKKLACLGCGSRVFGSM